jgi:hypothetical protein
MIFLLSEAGLKEIDGWREANEHTARVISSTSTRIWRVTRLRAG